MPTRIPAPRIRLPGGWPRRIRSAIVHAISLAHVALTTTRSHAANSWNARVRLKEENDRLRQELALLREEMRIKDTRMSSIPAQRRPHYKPLERLAILELRAARCWSLSESARHMLITTATMASWTHRLDDEGPRAIVRMHEPVNKFPEFVAYLVRRLKVLCPTMGKARIAQVLARAGLHLGPTTVRRMLAAGTRPRLRSRRLQTGRRVLANRPDHLWHLDLTTVPTALGFWISWLPFALPQRWPFCWWLTVAIDHYSRRVTGLAAFEKQPESIEVRRFLGRVIGRAGDTPRYIVTDQGKQFTANGFRRWCRRRGIHQRFGAVGKYGSIAVIERFIRTLKHECTRRLLVPHGRAEFRRELDLYADWHNADRPHSVLQGRTPDEVYHGGAPASAQARYEPRRRWPRGSPCAGSQAAIRGRCGVRVELCVSYRADRRHLPIVTLRRAA